MSHLDTFDPKPKKKEVMGKTEAIATKADDVLVGHYLPKTANVMDKVCVINSMNSTPGSPRAGHLHHAHQLHDARHHQAPVARRLGHEARRPHPPGTARLRRRSNSAPEHTGGGFFGAKYRRRPDRQSGPKACRIPPRPAGVSQEDFERRLALADKMNQQFHGRYPNADVKAYEELYREAIALMNSKDLKAFDLNAGIRSDPRALRHRPLRPGLPACPPTRGERRALRRSPARRLGHALRQFAGRRRPLQGVRPRPTPPSSPTSKNAAS